VFHTCRESKFMRCWRVVCACGAIVGQCGCPGDDKTIMERVTKCDKCRPPEPKLKPIKLDRRKRTRRQP